MIRFILVALLLLAAPNARADTIDYFMKFAGEAQAKAAAEMLAGHYDPTVSVLAGTGQSVVLGWAKDHTIANVQVWRPSQDVPGTDSLGNDIVTHTYQTGWFCIVAITSPAPIPALLNSPNLAFALNRTKREAGQAFVVKNNIGALITDIAVSPLPAMNNYYPIGGMN